jgi:hypothetical protein
MQTLTRTLVVCGALLASPLALAKEECGFFGDLIGSCRVGEDVRAAGEEMAQALKEAGYQMPKAARQLSLTTNQFGILVQEYHSPDPVIRNNARAIIHSVFSGVNIPTENKAILEVSVLFTNIDSPEPIHIDMKFVDSPKQSDWINLIDFDTAFKGEPIANAYVTSTLSDPELAARIRPFLLTAIDRVVTSPDWECAFVSNAGCLDQQRMNTKIMFAEQATMAIMEAMKTRETKATGNQILTRSWNGGIYALLLIPTEFLNNNPNLQGEILQHEARFIDKPVGEFRRSRKQLDMRKWRSHPVISASPNSAYSEYSWLAVDLHLTNYYRKINNLE